MRWRGKKLLIPLFVKHPSPAGNSRLSFTPGKSARGGEGWPGSVRSDPEGAEPGMDDQWISSPEWCSSKATATKSTVPIAASTASPTKSFMVPPLTQTKIRDGAGQGAGNRTGCGAAKPDGRERPWSPGRPVPKGGNDSGSHPLPRRANRRFRGNRVLPPSRIGRCRRGIRRRCR
jgi:hypothetical protein